MITAAVLAIRHHCRLPVAPSCVEESAIWFDFCKIIFRPQCVFIGLLLGVGWGYICTQNPGIAKIGLTHHLPLLWQCQDLGNIWSLIPSLIMPSYGGSSLWSVLLHCMELHCVVSLESNDSPVLRHNHRPELKQHSRPTDESEKENAMMMKRRRPMTVRSQSPFRSWDGISIWPTRISGWIKHHLHTTLDGDEYAWKPSDMTRADRYKYQSNFRLIGPGWQTLSKGENMINPRLKPLE